MNKQLSKTNNDKIKEKAAKIIQTKMKQYLLPHINRVTANINDRINYYKNIIKYLKFDKNRKNYCVRFYKFDKNKKPIFRIGNNIILKEQIGSPSTRGAIFLSSFRDIDKKLFKYVVKISPTSFKTPIEIKIIKILSNAVIKKLCPHFPISYGYASCKKDDLEKSSFIKSKESNYSNQIIPQFFLNNKNYYIYLNELASGDLKNFDLTNISLNQNKRFLDNKIAQLYLCLIFFYKETGCYHGDAQNRNFLYHKIKAGGYYHYNIFNQNYYLPNLGYLWVIWDYEHARSLTDTYNNFKYLLKMGSDFTNINRFIMNDYNIDDVSKIKNDLFTPSSTSLYDKVYDKKSFHKFIQSILDCLCELGYIFKKINKSNVIINSKPFIIKEISPM